MNLNMSINPNRVVGAVNRAMGILRLLAITHAITGWIVFMRSIACIVRRSVNYCLDIGFVLFNRVRGLRKLNFPDGFRLRNIVFGNGLLLQLGYNTSSLDIYDLMVELHPEIYHPVVGTKRRGFELESIMKDKSPHEIEDVKVHFAEALLVLVGDPTRNVEQAISFLSNFHNIHTLNFDPFTALVFDMLIKAPLGESFKYELNRFKSDHYHPIARESMPALPGTSNMDDSVRTSESKVDELTGMPINHTMGTTVGEDGFVEIAGQYTWFEWEKQTLFNPHGSLHYSVKRNKDGTQLNTYLKFPGLTLNKWGLYMDFLTKEKAEIVMVLNSDSDRKTQEINKHKMLQHALDRISKLEGDMYVYGLDFNKGTDKHIWDEIDGNAKLDNIYIAISKRDFFVRRKIRKLLPSKNNVFFFDRDLS